jgi:hypothetical protein
MKIENDNIKARYLGAAMAEILSGDGSHLDRADIEKQIASLSRSGHESYKRALNYSLQMER